MINKIENVSIPIIEKNFQAEAYINLKQEIPFDPRGILNGYDEGKRFVSISERNDSQIFSRDTIRYISYGKGKIHWKGVRMQKDPLCLTTYQQLIYEVKPKTIIEIGSFEGGSALFLQDYIDTLALDCTLYSLDIAPELLHETAKMNKKIKFLHCDLNSPEITINGELLSQCPHPWIIIEDAHVNLYNVLTLFSNFTQVEDYIVVEDTNPLKNGKIMNPLNFNMDDFEEFGDEKLKELTKWAIDHPNFLVDTYYCDFFGLNSTINLNGFLKQIK